MNKEKVIREGDKTYIVEEGSSLRLFGEALDFREHRKTPVSSAIGRLVHISPRCWREGMHAGYSIGIMAGIVIGLLLGLLLGGQMDGK